LSLLLFFCVSAVVQFPLLHLHAQFIKSSPLKGFEPTLKAIVRCIPFSKSVFLLKEKRTNVDCSLVLFCSASPSSLWPGCGFIIVQNDEILDLARLYKKLRISLIRSLAASASNSYCDIA
jgi:hypothetical protein